MINVLADIANGIGPPDDMFNKNNSSEMTLGILLIIIAVSAFIIFIATLITFDKKKENKAKKENNDELTCIICGKTSNGKHFCNDCYNEYKNSVIEIKITNCSKTQITKEYNNKEHE